jgi:hypothetical protein
MARFSEFKHWVQSMWYDHKREKIEWEGSPPDYGFRTWVNMNKWFIKSMWKARKENENDL